MENIFENKLNAILVASLIIASMVYGASLNPPSSVVQEDKRSPSGYLIAPIGT